MSLVLSVDSTISTLIPAEKGQRRMRSDSASREVEAMREFLLRPSFSSLFSEYASNISDDEDLKSELLSLLNRARNSKNNFISKDTICNMAKFACMHSASLNAVKYCVNKFIQHCNSQGISINDECWYYVFDGQGPEFIELSISRNGTLDIIKFLVSAGFDTKWRPVVQAACSANKIDILKFLVDHGAIVNWDYDEEGSNPYMSTNNPEIKAYLKQIGKKMGVTTTEFRQYDTL
jgi:hypothetical protein